MPKTLQLFVIHCSATPEGRIVTPGDIQEWHLAPKRNDNGTYTYKGKTYASVKSLPDETINGKSIRTITGRGWSKVGYADMIALDGTVINLVPYNEDDVVDPWEITNGATGINGIARHIVYAGGMDKAGKLAKDTRTPEQLLAMEGWVKATITFHPQIKGAGHNQFAQKDCPSFFVPDWLKSIGIGSKNIFRR